MPTWFVKRMLLVITAFMLSITIYGFSGTEIIFPVSSQELSFEQQILQYVNEYRQSKNLPPLQMNPVISAQAMKHSTSMASGKTSFGHDGFDGRVGAIVKQLASSKKFAENVAYGHLSAKEVVNVWLKSPGHRRNIEGNFSLTGIGLATRADGTVFFTQMFAAS